MSNAKLILILLFAAGTIYFLVSLKEEPPQVTLKPRSRPKRVEPSKQTSPEILDATQTNETISIEEPVPQIANPEISTQVESALETELRPITEEENDRLHVERSRAEFDAKPPVEKLADIEDYLEILTPLLIEKYNQNEIKELVNDTTLWINDPATFEKTQGDVKITAIKEFLEAWEMAKLKFSKNPSKYVQPSNPSGR